MSSSPTIARHILVAIALLAPAAALAAPIDRPMVVAEADNDPGDDGDDIPRQRGVADEPEATDTGALPARFGGSFGLDTFDAKEPPAVAAVNPGGVVCMAGCDGPSGALVHKTPKSKE